MSHNMDAGSDAFVSLSAFLADEVVMGGGLGPIVGRRVVKVRKMLLGRRNLFEKIPGPALPAPVVALFLRTRKIPTLRMMPARLAPTPPTMSPGFGPSFAFGAAASGAVCADAEPSFGFGYAAMTPIVFLLGGDDCVGAGVGEVAADPKMVYGLTVGKVLVVGFADDCGEGIVTGALEGWETGGRVL